jgi:sugar phosphate isomerase/epimerase
LTGGPTDVAAGANGDAAVVGASTVAWFYHPLHEALARAAALVPLVEIFSAHHHSLLEPANLQAALACERRLTVHAPWAGLDLGSLDEDQRRAAVAAHGQEIERAAAIGAEVYVVHPDGVGERAPGWSERAARGALARSFDALLSLQEQHGIAVAIENLPDPRTSLFTAPGLDLRGLGFTLDAGHAAMAGSLGEFLRSVDGMRHIHLHDNHGPRDFVDRHLALGRGVVDVPAVLQTACATGTAVVLELIDEDAVVESLDLVARLG